MLPSEIPQEHVDIVNEASGREHTRDGSVLATLARVLTRHEELVEQRFRAYGNQAMEPARTDQPRELPPRPGDPLTLSPSAQRTPDP